MNLNNLAKKIIIETLRMTHHGKSSHIGSILSIVDIITVLYGKILKINTRSFKKKKSK